MRGTLLAVTWVAMCLAGCPRPAPFVTAPDTGALYARLKRAAVEVVVAGHNNGSGFLVGSHGDVITALHVVGPRPRGLEILWAGRRVQAEVVAVDKGHDLALLRMLGTASTGPAGSERGRLEPGIPGVGVRSGLELCDELPPAGTPLMLYGQPQYRHDVMLPGIVGRDGATFEWLGDQSAYLRVVHVGGASPWGVSGGPWVTLDGHVAGLQSGMMIHHGAMVGIAYIIPVDAIERLVRTRRSAATPTLRGSFEELWEHGSGLVGRFGPGAAGLVVRWVGPGPLQRAGVRSWELIVGAAGRPVVYRDDLLGAVRSRHPGDSLTLQVRNGPGPARTVEVTLDRLEDGWLPPAAVR